MIRILAVGDVVGRPGRVACAHFLPELKKTRGIDFIVVNAENSASGAGINEKIFHELRGYGRLVSAIGVSPELLDILAIPGFCASEGRGLGLADLDRLAEQGREIRAGEESPSKVKLPRPGELFGQFDGRSSRSSLSKTGKASRLSKAWSPIVSTSAP